MYFESCKISEIHRFILPDVDEGEKWKIYNIN